MEIAAPAILVGEDGFVAGGYGVARGGDVDGEERGGVYVAGFAPVEARVGDDYFGTGDEQGEKRDDRKPVSDSDGGGVTRCFGIGGGRRDRTSLFSESA